MLGLDTFISFKLNFFFSLSVSYHYHAYRHFECPQTGINLLLQWSQEFPQSHFTYICVVLIFMGLDVNLSRPDNQLSD